MGMLGDIGTTVVIKRGLESPESPSSLLPTPFLIVLFLYTRFNSFQTRQNR